MSDCPEFDSDAVFKWLQEFHKASATLDVGHWVDGFMADDVELQYANSPVIKGDEARQMFKTVLSKLDMMTHEVRYFDYVAPRIYQAATIRYLVKGDNHETDVITIPGFAVFSISKDSAGRVKTNRIETYLDPSPVFRRIAEKSKLE